MSPPTILQILPTPELNNPAVLLRVRVSANRRNGAASTDVGSWPKADWSSRRKPSNMFFSNQGDLKLKKTLLLLSLLLSAAISAEAHTVGTSFSLYFNPLPVPAGPE
jgi:hypothetical protein